MAYQYRNPQLLPDGRIDCEVLFSTPPHLAALGWIPYTADANDAEPRSIGKELHAIALADPNLGRDRLSPTTLLENRALVVRAERDRRLSETDWTQLPDVPEATRTLWAEYRQALRDIPAQAGFPKRVVWPPRP